MQVGKNVALGAVAFAVCWRQMAFENGVGNAMSTMVFAFGTGVSVVLVAVSVAYKMRVD